MRKVLFLMFLLLLMGLGTAGVKAQVRIGGNTAPSKAAVLDLNATDAANTGTGGLVLPRVNLTSTTMQLTAGVANVTGTMVYDVTATLGRIGIYFWNGAQWVLASLPPTSAADSGKILIVQNGVFVASVYPQRLVAGSGTMSPTRTPAMTAFEVTVQTPTMAPNYMYVFNVPGLLATDLCSCESGEAFMPVFVYGDRLAIIPTSPNTTPGPWLFTCLRHT